MAFVVETGAVVAGANAYVTVEEFKTYHSDRANSYTATDPEIQGAIIKATMYIDGHYRNRWKGIKTNYQQRLQWPRFGVVRDSDQRGDFRVDHNDYLVSTYGYLPSNIIPDLVKEATCEAAYRALSGRLADDLTPGIKRQKVDVIETEYSSSSAETTRYQDIDFLLSGLLRSSNDLVRG